MSARLPLRAFAIVLAAFAPMAARAAALEPLEIDTASGPHHFVVEIVADEASRAHGLMNRRYLPRDRGMLFEFDRLAPVGFWMKDTYIPLDMIFIAPNGVVTRVAANAEPLSEDLIPSGPPCIGVLEVNGGVAAEIGLKAGDKVKASFFKP